MARELLHRIIANDRPTVIRVEAADYYRPERNKKRIADRVDPEKVIVTKFHYLFAKYGAKAVAKDYLGINLGITTISELEANPLWLETNASFRSARSRPQTLRKVGEYLPSDLVLLVPKAGPIFMGKTKDYLNDFMGSFFYMVDHFPAATEHTVVDPDKWKMWLGVFFSGYIRGNVDAMIEVNDHILALDKTMEPWYK